MSLQPLTNDDSLSAANDSADNEFYNKMNGLLDFALIVHFAIDLFAFRSCFVPSITASGALRSSQLSRPTGETADQGELPFPL